MRTPPRDEDTSLAALVTRASLRRFAYGASYTRGLRYFKEGRVTDLAEDGRRLRARVKGTRVYRVELLARSGLGYYCDCPVGSDRLFCKHCVAVGLAWLDSRAPRSGATVTKEGIRTHLLSMDKEILAELLLAQANKDSELNKRLSLEMLACGSAGAGTEALEHAISQAAYELRQAGLYGTQSAAERLRRLFEMINRMPEERSSDAIALARYALALLAPLAARPAYYDRLSGPLYREALAFHLELCRRHRPDLRQLAQWLFERMTSVQKYGLRFEDYVPALGDEGGAEFRRLALQAWNAVPVIEPHDTSLSEKLPLRRRFGPVMKEIADFTGSIDDYLHIWERDLSSPDQFARIAEAHAAAGRHALAIEWAERGIKAFRPIGIDSLRRLLVKEYLAAGRANDALNLVWEQFSEAPFPENYERLRAAAQETGQWPVWREEALEFLRDRAQRKNGPGPEEKDVEKHWPFGDWLVRILLDEGDLDGAWRSARGIELSDKTFTQLVQARAKTRPLDAAVAFRELAEKYTSEQYDRDYRRAVKLLAKSARLYKRGRRPQEFQEWLAGFRDRHKRKRALLRLLDSTRWP